ncbi:UNVERIFIED_CONTAM: hypothetical protein RMT77_004982 [Armadillidium vulgare]
MCLTLFKSFRFTLKLPEKLMTKLMEKSLQNLPPQIRPTPMSLKIIIISTWRSGTSFLNDILSSHDGVFSHYEPLHHFGIKRFRDKYDPESVEAQKFIKGVLNCEYVDKTYFSNLQANKFIVRNNKIFWNLCQNEEYENECYTKDFLEASCSLFPIHVIKTVRLGVPLLESLLEDRSTNLHVIFLVRDPRAVMSSRKSKKVIFCRKNPECADPAILCHHMNNDHKEFLKLSIKHSERIHLLRYEDLAKSPIEIIKNLMNKFGLSINKNMEDFINNRTSNELANAFSTYKISKNHINDWQLKLNREYIADIEKDCLHIMKIFGYELYSKRD